MVDQSVLKIELVPDVQVTGTVGQPSLVGQVAIQDDGRIQAGGRTYRLTDSRLEFSPSTGLIPRLNVIGETRVSSYLVTLRMTGPATDIATNFSSDPPLGEQDVRSLLVTGQTTDPTRGSDSERFAVGAVSGDVLGVAGQFVGIERLGEHHRVRHAHLLQMRGVAGDVDHLQVWVQLARAARHVEPAGAGPQVDVGDQHGEGPRLAFQDVVGAATGVGAAHLIAAVRERFLDHLRDEDLVFDQQNLAHAPSHWQRGPGLMAAAVQGKLRLG